MDRERMKKSGKVFFLRVFRVQHRREEESGKEKVEEKERIEYNGREC
jgi:hypothetical protein